jgi:ATP citrate (pro-S)-lyase
MSFPSLLRALLNKFTVCHQCATANPDGQRRALVVGGGIANFTDVAATFNGIIRAMHEKVLSTV